MVALRIAKLGYYNGDLDNVLNANVDHVLSILDYESFNVDYERVHTEMNKPEGS